MDTTGRRIVKHLIQVVEDYPDGENDMIFDVSYIIMIWYVYNYLFL